jgi:hypothetical protein
VGYARQSSTVERLTNESWRVLDAMGVKHKAKLHAKWQETRKRLMGAIAQAYHQSASRRKKLVWDLNEFRISGAQARLGQEIRSILEQFQASGVSMARTHFNEVYKESLMRHAWILDNVTPASQRVKLPHDKKLHEAAITVYSAVNKSASDWVERWSNWSDAWQSALQHNLQLGAMNKSSIQDAMNEVDATRASTPAYNIWDAIARLNDYESLVAASRGAADLADLNGDMVDVEIWKTRGDLRVCDDCDELDGTPIDEADAYPPLHPNCHCYPLVVPAEYAELLRNGSEEDRALASQAMDAGIVPNSIIIRNSEGDIGAQAIVDFEKWKSEAGYAVRSE